LKTHNKITVVIFSQVYWKISVKLFFFWIRTKFY